VNWLDVWLAITFLISIVAGLGEGFTKAGIGLISSVLGLVLGLEYYRPLAVSLRPYISHTGTADLAGFLIVFIGISIVGSVASGILARFVHEVHLVWLDRLLGGGVGVIRGLLWAVVTIWALMAFLPVTPGFVVSGSRLAPVVMDAARRVADGSPDEVKQSFRHSYRELNKVLPENVKARLSRVPATVPTN